MGSQSSPQTNDNLLYLQGNSCLHFEQVWSDHAHQRFCSLDDGVLVCMLNVRNPQSSQH